VYQPVQLTMPPNVTGTPGGPIALTAPLATVPGGAPVAGQTVTFSASGFPSCDALTDANGVASCNVDSVALTGAATVTATFDNPTDFFTDHTGDLPPLPEIATTTLQISAATTTAVASSANPSTVGQPVTLTATVAANPSGAGTPTGSVTFSDGSVVFGSAALNGSGTAAVTTSFTTAGSHLITATYGGDANFADSTSAALTQTVVPSLVGVTTSPLPGAQVGVPYNDTLAVGGGAPPYTWSLTGGALPAGLTLHPSGTITGTPSAPGSTTFTVQVTDASTPPQDASVQLSLTVPVPPAVTSIYPAFGPPAGGPP
jgi:hypothetical protein